MKSKISTFMLLMVFFTKALCIEQSVADTNIEEKPSVNLSLLTSQFIDADYEEKSKLIEAISNIKAKPVIPFLEALLEGNVFYVKSLQKVVYKKESEAESLAAIDVINNENYGTFKQRKFKKIGINNSLRGDLKSVIAQLQISDEDASVRKLAALNILKTADDSALPIIEKALTTESDSAIKEILLTAQALVNLSSDNLITRFKALQSLEGSLYTESRNGLNQFIALTKNQPQKYNQAETQLAEKTLKDINKIMQINDVAQNVYFGISLGAVLLLAAIGLAITFGVMGVINMAHGEMIMLGAYTTFLIQQLMPNYIDISLMVAIPAAFLVSGLVGVVIERTVIRHLYGRPLETLLATFGISLVLQQAVRSIFGPLNQDVQTPDWMAGTFTVNAGLELTFNRLYIIIFSLMVLAALAVVLKKTLFGLQMRAVTMNRPMASSMGIKTGWVDALTFGLGSGIAGIAGVALSQLTNVGPNLGQAYIIDSFMVVVFGGVGNLWGTLVGAMSLGVANKMIEPMAGAVLAKIIVLVAIILFIQKRPRGLFALKGRAVEG